MKITLISVGKTADKRLNSLIQDYLKKINFYCAFTVIELVLKKKKGDSNKVNIEEAHLILNNIPEGATLILLDEKGKNFTSRGFSVFLQKRLNEGGKDIVFLIGGAYGFSNEVYERANFKVGLSQMTFTHQMVRLIFVEQLYRGFTILKGEKYHH